MTFLFLLISFSAFATKETALAGGAAAFHSEAMMPNIKGFGQIVNPQKHPELEAFTKEMMKSFSFEWTEQNFSPKVKKMLSQTSSSLAKMLPVSSIVYSNLKQDSHNLSFSYLARSKDNVTFKGSVVIEEGKIVAISVSENTN